MGSLSSSEPVPGGYQLLSQAPLADRGAVRGRWVDRALDNVLPLSVDPQTEDAALDEEFRWRWEQWASEHGRARAVLGKLEG